MSARRRIVLICIFLSTTMGVFECASHLIRFSQILNPVISREADGSVLIHMVRDDVLSWVVVIVSAVLGALATMSVRLRMLR